MFLYFFLCKNNADGEVCVELNDCYKNGHFFFTAKNGPMSESEIYQHMQNLYSNLSVHFLKLLSTKKQQLYNSLKNRKKPVNSNDNFQSHVKYPSSGQCSR